MKLEHLFSRQCYPVDIYIYKKMEFKKTTTKTCIFKHKYGTNHDECLQKKVMIHSCSFHTVSLKSALIHDQMSTKKKVQTRVLIWILCHVLLNICTGCEKSETFIL